ncbi:MAG: RNA polymerase factor sigma-32 [Deltaproteobacteria bacterium]|nr:RNA polymerase factor sigma-32 [Deltaproteobacteria bacterium]
MVARYMAEVGRIPLLTAEEERQLARKYVETQDSKYAQQLVQGNLRFVLRIAQEFRGYGVPFLDLVQEGNLGLMVAVKRFDPECGHRLVSYAVWWIRAYMRASAMHTWSMVKIGTTQVQRRLFFSLRATQSKADAAQGAGRSASSGEVADRLGVRECDVQSMGARLAGRDVSLDQQLGEDGHDCRIDHLPAATPAADEVVAKREAGAMLQRELHAVAPLASEKQAYVLEHRLRSQQPKTLQQIARCLGVSRERVRQIEGSVLQRLRAGLEARGLAAAG